MESVFIDEINQNESYTIADLCNVNAVSSDDQLIITELLKIKKRQEAMNIKISNLRNEENQIHDLMQKSGFNKLNLKTKIEEVQNKLENEVYQETVTTNHILQLHNKTKTIGELILQAKNILRNCSENKILLKDAIKKLKNEIDITIYKLEKINQSVVSAMNTYKDTVEQQKNSNNSKNHQLDDDCLKTETDITQHNREIESFNKTLNNEQEMIAACHDTITEIEEENDLLKYENDGLQQKLEQFNLEIEQKQSSFLEDKEQLHVVSNNTDDEIEKSEQEIQSLTKTQKNKDMYNNSLMAKMKIVEEQGNNLLIEIDQSETLCKGKKNALTEADVGFQTLLNCKFELQHKEKNIIEEQNILEIFAQEIEGMEELIINVNLNKETLKGKLDVLKLQHEALDKNLKEEVEVVGLLSAKFQNKTQTFMDYQSKIIDFETGEAKFKQDLNIKLSSLMEQLEHDKQAEQEVSRTMINEMNQIKSTFDKDSKLKTPKYEENIKDIQDELQNYKNEMDKVIKAQMEMNVELTKLNRNFNSLSATIEYLESEEHKNHLAEVAAVAVAKVPSPTTKPASTKSQIFAPRDNSRKNLEFHDLSGSSAEGTTITLHDYMREKSRKQTFQDKKRKRSSPRK